jgi:hypothetical protein
MLNDSRIDKIIRKIPMNNASPDTGIGVPAGVVGVFVCVGVFVGVSVGVMEVGVFVAVGVTVGVNQVPVGVGVGVPQFTVSV